MAFSLNTERSRREVERFTENRYKKGGEKNLQETMDRGAGDKGEQATKGYLFKGQQESRGSQFYERIFGQETFSGLSKNSPLLTSSPCSIIFWTP